MTRAPNAGEIETAFLEACHAELAALKPGNVHKFSAGHGMDVTYFERAAAAAAPHIANATLSVGKRILRATEASIAATGVNTNLGIVLLSAPLAKAASEISIGAGLRRRLADILANLDENDAADAFAAIRLANPAGLGAVDDGDVSNTGPSMTLIAAMHLAKDRDRIANAYVTAFEDIFDFALPRYSDARCDAETEALAVSTLHMALLAEFPDSHIVRKYGAETAESVRQEAISLRPAWNPVVTAKSLAELTEFDQSLKSRALNPGTTADFVVATLFAARLSKRKQS